MGLTERTVKHKIRKSEPVSRQAQAQAKRVEAGYSRTAGTQTHATTQTAHRFWLYLHGTHGRDAMRVPLGYTGPVNLWGSRCSHCRVTSPGWD